MGNSPLPGWWKATMWGMSPACDLLELIDKKKLGPHSGLDKNEINILLVGQKDIRHSLQTLKAHWKTLKENGVRINFYAVESCLEQYARQMLFWKIAFEPNNKLELQEKVKQFMEVFGNSMVRPETWKTVTSYSESLMNILTSRSNSPQHEIPLLDFSQVKYQERNRLVEIIKFWTDNCSSQSMRFHWNKRIHHDLGARFPNAYTNFRQDNNTNLTAKGLETIALQEYVHFRSYGIALMFEEEELFTQSNLTLVSSVETSVQSPGYHHGVATYYWGDIITGPFICHGVECEDSSVFETVRIYIDPQAYELSPTRASDITIRNLKDIFNVISNDPLPADEPANDNNNESTGPNQNPNVAVHFVSMSNFNEFPSNPKYKEFFDVVYFGNSMIDHLLPDLTPIFASDVILLVENARYVYNFPAEEEELFTAKINETATNIGFEQIDNFKSHIYKYDNYSVDGELKPAILKYVMKLQKNSEESSDTGNAVSPDLPEIPQNPDPQTETQQA